MGVDPGGGKHRCKANGVTRWGWPLRCAIPPPGCSKWNPIEHRLFSHISINWAGQPLRSFETMLGLIRGTRTRTGLTVSAHRLDGLFETGKKVTAAVMKTLNMTRHAICPQWNYTFRPRLGQAPAPGTG